MRALVIGALAMLAVLAGCGESDEKPADVIGGEPAADNSPAVELPEPVSDSSTAGGVVDRADYAGNPKAEAAARFYEELWSSYQNGKMTAKLPGLMTGEAAAYFPKSVREVAAKGHILNRLTEATVVKVKGSNVHVCMAAVSTQDIDAETGEPVEQAEPGDIEYRVDVVQQGGHWRVAGTRGFTQSPCGGNPQ